MKYIISFVLMASMFFLLPGCKTTTATSYTVHSYTTYNGELRDMHSASSYVSFENSLIEFRLGLRTYDSLFGDGSGKRYKVAYDTIAVFYLDPGSRRFYELDTFDVKHRIIGKGKYSEKEKGVPLRDTLVYHEDEMIPGSLRDTVMDGKRYKVINARMPDVGDGRKRKSMMFFTEKASFNSIMNQIAVFRSHPDWAYVAGFMMDIESADVFLARVEDIKPASKEDIEKFKAIRKTVQKAGGK